MSQFIPIEEGQILWASTGGLVANAVTGVSLIGAAVQLALVVGTDETVVANLSTGNDGSFVFSNLAPGNYEVTVSFSGYVPQTQAVTVVGRNFSLLSFPLSPVAVSSSSSSSTPSSSSNGSSTGTV